MIVVTGATGFLGAHIVCQLLAKGYRVKALRRQNSSLQEFEFIFRHYFPETKTAAKHSAQLFWVESDILDVESLAEAIKGCRWVFHVAALVSFDPADRERLMKVNVEGTANIVNLCLELGVPNLAYVSSVASLGRRKSGDRIDENTKWSPGKNNTRYAVSKYKAELEVWRGAEEGLRVVMVNPGVLLGVGDFTRGSNAIIHTVFKGMPGYTTGINGYVDVKDVARALIQLSESEVSNRRFILVGENLAIRDLFTKISDGFGISPPFIRVRPWMAAIVWRLLWVQRRFTKKGLSITKETARTAFNQFHYSSDLIKKELDFVFTPMQNTIAECCAHYSKFINRIP